MKLYEIDAAIEAAIEAAYESAINPETGEVLQDIDFTEVENLNAAREEKLENIGLYIKDLEADAAKIKAERDKLVARQKAKENKAERLRQFLTDYMLNGEQSKFESARIKLSLRKSDAVEVANTDLLPERYVKVSIDKKPMKVELKKALKGGAVIAGVTLVEKQNLTIA